MARLEPEEGDRAGAEAPERACSSAITGNSRYSWRGVFPIMLSRNRHVKGQETVTIDPSHVRGYSEWSDTEIDLDDLVLPDGPQWQRCGAVHCIDHGPWLGTLVCCIRRSGHDDFHSMSLGDAGSPDYWRETWL